MNFTHRITPDPCWKWFVCALITMISAGCSLNQDENLVVESTFPGLEITPSLSSQVDMQASVLGNCDIVSQEAALSPDQRPDWTSLPLNSCYQLWLELQDDLTEYKGKAQITYTNLNDETLDDLVLRLYPNADRIYGGTLEVSSARVDGTQVLPIMFLSDNTGLVLSLDDPIESGETVVIELEFNGSLTDGMQDAPGTYGIFNYALEEGVATFVNWYPILAVRDDGQWQAEPVVGIGDSVVSEVSLYKVEITTPKKIQVVTPGSKVQQVSRDSNEIYTFASGPVRDFPVVASSNFTLAQTEVDGIVIQHWGLADGELRWKEAMQTSADSLAVFNELFGPYPYKELDIVSVPLQLASGVEYPGLFLMKDELYQTDPELPYLLSTIIAHETAHQWWYGLVGNDVIEFPWQDEALATFSSLLYLEQLQPSVYQGTVNFFKQSVDGVDKKLVSSDISQPVRAFKNHPEYYSPVVYSKGALFFVELRSEIGNQVFFTALQNYFSENLYAIASPENLLDEFENTCQCELGDFYTEWGVE
jgi:aminopeptidase N